MWTPVAETVLATQCLTSVSLKSLLCSRSQSFWWEELSSRKLLDCSPHLSVPSIPPHPIYPPHHPSTPPPPYLSVSDTCWMCLWRTTASLLSAMVSKCVYQGFSFLFFFFFCHCDQNTCQKPLREERVVLAHVLRGSVHSGNEGCSRQFISWWPGSREGSMGSPVTFLFYSTWVTHIQVGLPP